MKEPVDELTRQFRAYRQQAPQPQKNDKFASFDTRGTYPAILDQEATTGQGTATSEEIAAAIKISDTIAKAERTANPDCRSANS